MVQGYYTLQEAAQFLNLPVEQLKQMAQKGQIRSFQDRGTLRFRVQDIQELARQRSVTSDPELVLGDASLPPKSSAAPSSSGRRKAQQHAPKSALKKAESAEVFDFSLDSDSVDLGADLVPPPSGVSARHKAGSSKSKKAHTPSKPAPGSDSDVRLVSDGSDVSFSVGKDSDIKLADSQVKLKPDPNKPKTSMTSSSGGKRSSQVALGSGVQPPVKTSTGLSSKQQSLSKLGGVQPIDSGVRLVPIDKDSDVQILGASDEVPLGAAMPSSHIDSNVRLDRVKLPPADSGEGSMMQTEEINLDEEMLKQAASAKDQPPPKVRAKSAVKFPTTSPFELSDSDMSLPSELLDEGGPKTPNKQPLEELEPSNTDFEVGPSLKDDTSSNFDLLPSAPQEESSSNFDLPAGTDSPVDSDSDFSLEIPTDYQEQVMHGEQANEQLTGSGSGLSLSNPDDAGISLEQPPAEADEQAAGGEFDLSLDLPATPRPTPSSPAEDSDSDFQLQAGGDASPTDASPSEGSGSSDFDLSMEPAAEGAAPEGASSSSDFDLSMEPAPEGDAQADAPQEQPAEEELDFSLNVDTDQAEAPSEGSSEFELNLGDEGAAAAAGSDSSDSEFELTLDDSGSVAEMEVSDESAPQVKPRVSKAKGKSKLKKLDDEEDIFELPDLEAEGETAPADSDSDFDLALEDSDLANEEESGSQVVALDEEDIEEIGDSDGDAVVDDVEVEEESSDFGDLDADTEGGAAEDEEEEEVVGETVIKEKLVPAAPWGVMPVIFMLPCVVIMFLVALLGYEVMQTSAGLRAPGPLTMAVADMLQNPITLKK